MKWDRSLYRFAIITALLLSGFDVYGQADTAGKKLKLPRHYFANTLYFDMYSIGETNIPTKGLTGNELDLAKRLQKYQYSQTVGGFYFPFRTTEKVHDDGRVSNWHWLGTANYMLAMPRFDNISNHNLMKLSLGVRAIYNSGAKGIWFIDMAPFVSGDMGIAGTFATRWGTTVLYDRMVSDNFSFRVGYTRTFVLGNRLHLPYLGIRIGKLNRTYFSAQFPRGLTFSTPMGSKWRFSIFTKPTGSLLTMGNTDSLYNGATPKGRLDSTIIFGRYDGLFGFRFDYNPSRYVSVFVEFGHSNVRGIAFFSRDYNSSKGIKNDVEVFKPFFVDPLKGSGFLSFGLTVRIGRTRSVYNNYNMYEVFNTNTTIAPGDNTNNVGDGNIPPDLKLRLKKEETNLKTKDVQDLIEAQDLYN